MSSIIEWFMGLSLTLKIAITVTVIVVAALIIFVLIPALHPPYVEFAAFKWICPENAPLFSAQVLV